MLAVQLVGGLLMALGAYLLLAQIMNSSEGNITLPTGIKIQLPASVLVLFLGTFVFMFPFSPWWPSAVSSPTQDPTASPDSTASQEPSTGLPTGELVYVRDGSDIVWLRPGEAPKVVAPSSGRDRQPDWSPNGQEVVFVSDRADGRLNCLWVATVETNQAELLTCGPSIVDPPADAGTFDPAWSPDGGRIAFTLTESGRRDLYVYERAGGRFRRVEQGTFRFALRPTWSDDSTILFSGTDGGPGNPSQVARVNADGSGFVRLTESSFNDGHPTSSPDGRIVFDSDRSGGRSLWQMNAEGEEVEPFGVEGDVPSTRKAPDWSSDGSWLAFVGSDGHADAIYVVRAEGTGLRRVVNAGDEPSDPAWWTPPGGP